MKNTFVSFVVDNIFDHYYKAELLLLSLEHFALYSKENIIVQCTDNVSKEFITYLNSNNYNYHIISRYLDDKFCNKIQQLEFFNNHTGANVVLVDADTFFLEPIEIPDINKFSAKIVDAPNPCLKTIVDIFETAQVALPDIVKTDWEIDDGSTISTNFNGGFYFIPAKYVHTINVAWKKWSQWLFMKKYLFKDPGAVIHLDQVSMALAICETQVDYFNLPANFNCPIHSNNPQRSYQKDRPIALIHYHKEISNSGILNYDKSANMKIRKAIKKANEKIIEQCSFTFLNTIHQV
jgi:hypothetical protein